MNDLDELIGLFELAADHPEDTYITQAESQEIVRILKALQPYIPAQETQS